MQRRPGAGVRGRWGTGPAWDCGPGWNPDPDALGPHMPGTPPPLCELYPAAGPLTGCKQC